MPTVRRALAAEAALEARSRVEDAYNRARPRYYADTPVIGKVDVEMIGPADVRKLYADYGPSMPRKGHKSSCWPSLSIITPRPGNVSKRTRPLPASMAPEAALAAAIEREKATFAAILGHVPVSRADAADKVAFLVSRFEDDPYFVFTHDELQTLFQSFAAGA
ncbi:MAG: hypothetical protein IPK28_04790 [Devosia sp.]|nr:hypothetical protein [Devosia sp.]